MTAQLYYLPSYPGISPQPVSLANLASLSGWQGVERFFCDSIATRLPGGGEALAATTSLDISGAGFICAEVTSTFDLAWELVKHDLLPCWGFVLAATQNSGRGQLRRPWQSKPGNLYVTFRLPEDLNTEAGALLTGYLLRQALGALGAVVNIKWPNDLIQNHCKVGGILLEERGGVLLAGVGLNLNDAPDMASLAAGDNSRAFPAGVLRGAHAPLNLSLPGVLNVWLKLVKQVTLSYEQELCQLPLEQRPALLESCLAFKGSMVSITDPGFVDAGPSFTEHSISGVINGLGPNGELRLLLASGRERLLHSGTLNLER